MPTHRRAYAVEHGIDGITVGLFTDNPEREKEMVPVRIPVDRGLTGYRVLLIHAADQQRFSAVTGVADLEKFRVGLLPWWDDAAVLKRANVPLVPGGTYDGLFQMLAAHRFDALSRSAREILPEYEHRKEGLPDLAIEKHLLLHYPMPVYFWFRDDEQGRRRAERVRTGLAEMVADGTLKKMFDAEFGPGLAKLDLGHRLVLELTNPLLDGDSVPEDPKLWYRP
jgi:ABC-type amino acid transport substrate-binding protein